MRNCEQSLGSLGLFAYRVGSLDQLDEALSAFGQTAIERQNIQVASFSGTKC